MRNKTKNDCRHLKKGVVRLGEGTPPPPCPWFPMALLESGAHPVTAPVVKMLLKDLRALEQKLPKDIPTLELDKLMTLLESATDSSLSDPGLEALQYLSLFLENIKKYPPHPHNANTYLKWACRLTRSLLLGGLPDSQPEIKSLMECLQQSDSLGFAELAEFPNHYWIFLQDDEEPWATLLSSHQRGRGPREFILDRALGLHLVPASVSVSYTYNGDEHHGILQVYCPDLHAHNAARVKGLNKSSVHLACLLDLLLGDTKDDRIETKIAKVIPNLADPSAERNKVQQEQEEWSKLYEQLLAQEFPDPVALRHCEETLEELQEELSVFKHDPRGALSFPQAHLAFDSAFITIIMAPFLSRILEGLAQHFPDDVHFYHRVGERLRAIQHWIQRSSALLAPADLSPYRCAVQVFDFPEGPTQEAAESA